MSMSWLDAETGPYLNKSLQNDPIPKYDFNKYAFIYFLLSL